MRCLCKLYIDDTKFYIKFILIYLAYIKTFLNPPYFQIFMIYDVHAHLDLLSKKELVETLYNIKKHNVGFVITASVDIASAKKTISLYKKYGRIKMALGLYPQDALSREDGEAKNDTYEDLEKLVLKYKKKIIAISEIGMDFKNGSRKNEQAQEKLFRQQLELAQKIEVPAIIHTRAAEKEILEVLKDYPKLTKILHCFCGNMKLVKTAAEMGCYFSIPCSIGRMENFKKLLEIVPKTKVLTETDSPYLSPFKDRRNQPAFIKETIKEIGKVWVARASEVEKLIEKNTKVAFRLKHSWIQIKF